MRELILMRHAEAAPHDSDGTDFARPLTARGNSAAVAAAIQMRRQHGAPDYLVCSPAARTAATATAVRTALQLESLPLHSDARVYLATPATLLQVLAESPAAARRVLLVAHNPAVSELAAVLHSGHGHARPLATAEFRCIRLPIEHWQALPELP